MSGDWVALETSLTGGPLMYKKYKSVVDEVKDFHEKKLSNAVEEQKNIRVPS